MRYCGRKEGLLVGWKRKQYGKNDGRGGLSFVESDWNA
jgi:hypothetical protein